MIGIENGIERGEDSGSTIAIGRALMPNLVWFAGLFSTLYLVGWALFLVLLSIGFSSYLKSSTDLEKAVAVGLDAIPLCCFTAIGFVGLKLWSRGRFRLWGLSAILLQTVCAICAFVHPLGILVLFPWFG